LTGTFQTLTGGGKWYIVTVVRGSLTGYDAPALSVYIDKRGLLSYYVFLANAAL